MITVLIRCSNDYKVFECIQSIKKTSSNSFIIVSITPNKKLQNDLTVAEVNYCAVPKYNAAVTNNAALELIKTEKVIITDADTIFEKGTIRLLKKALDKYDVVKPKLVFRSEKKTFFLSLVANLRTFFNKNANKMYIPGLAFNLGVKKLIGGYFFDERIPWGEDSDFSERVNKSGLKTKVIKKALLYHPLIDAKHDLADAFLIGSKKQNNEKIKDNLVLKRINFYKGLFKNYGLMTLFYGILWYLSFDIGQTTRKIKYLHHQLEFFSWQILSKKEN